MTTMTSRSFHRFVRPGSIGAVLLVAGSTALSAHDFFLVPGALSFPSGNDVEILAQSSSRFPTSAGAIAFARVSRAVMIGSEGETPLTNMSHRGTSLVLRSRPESNGQRLVAVDLVSRSARQTPAGFVHWLKLEGAGDAAERIAAGTRLNGLDSITRTDTKHAKTIIEVGRGGPRSFSRRSGQMIEFVPARDPSSLRAGDTLRVRILFKDAPLAGISVHASVPAPEDTTQKGEPDIHLVTDAQGELSLPVRKTGLWLIRTIHVLEASRGNWETHWASLVFTAGT